MEIIESYFDGYNEKTIDSSIYKRYEVFGYDNPDLFKFHVDFLMKNIYELELVDNKKKRLSQGEFRKQIIERYGACIITRQKCLRELEAAHIIPIYEDDNYDIDNGLLLTRNLHSTFDDYLWSINPETLCIEIRKDCEVGSISEYENRKLEINVNRDLLYNLRWHYNKFLKKID